MIRPFRRVSCVVVVLVASAVSAAAQTPRAMTIVDLINVPRLGEPQISPDGSAVVFVRTDPDWKANKRIGHIWRADTAGRQVVQMTAGEEGETTPRWSPDGRSVAFVAKRPGKDAAQVFIIGMDGGEARAVTSHDTAVSNIAWSPDGKAIYFLASDPKIRRRTGARKGERRCVRVRRELRAAASLEGECRHEGRDPSHDRRDVGSGLSDVAGRREDRVPARPQPALRRCGAWRNLADGGGRLGRDAADDERHWRERGGAVARQFAGPVRCCRE